jgi:hypothetical protein
VTAIRALLKDRKRSQRGSVLSGVLMMTAFIAIISGALMTELSTNFLLSHTMLNRVTNQATLNSAIELSLSQLQATRLNAPCPALATTTVNNLTASAMYLSCWPTIREDQKFTRVGSSSASFNLDGAQAQANGFNDYVVGNSSGSVLDYRFGATTPRWTVSLNGTLTAPPLVFGDPGSANQLLDLFPITGAACSPNTNCIDVRTDKNSTPSVRCTVPATYGSIVSQPAPSPTFGAYAFFTDGPRLEVIDLSSGECDAPTSSIAPFGNRPVIAGPIALRCSGCGRSSDEVYVVVSDNVSSWLVRSNFRNRLSFVDALPLPWANVAGMAASGSGLPASIAITFGGGGITLVQLDSSGAMTGTSTTVPAGISSAPYWCSVCGNLFGVGAQNGALYVFDSALTRTSYATGSPINTSPSTDLAGNWYVGSDDGFVHELQLQGGQGLVQVRTYGQMARFGSSPQLGTCTGGICIYLGAENGNVYLVPLDARDAVMSACISTSPPACSPGTNPRLWAQVEIGASGNPKAVHVQGWSYYSA